MVDTTIYGLPEGTYTVIIKPSGVANMEWIYMGVAPGGSGMRGHVYRFKNPECMMTLGPNGNWQGTHLDYLIYLFAADSSLFRTMKYHERFFVPKYYYGDGHVGVISTVCNNWHWKNRGLCKWYPLLALYILTVVASKVPATGGLIDCNQFYQTLRIDRSFFFKAIGPIKQHLSLNQLVKFRSTQMGMVWMDGYERTMPQVEPTHVNVAQMQQEDSVPQSTGDVFERGGSEGDDSGEEESEEDDSEEEGSEDDDSEEEESESEDGNVSSTSEDMSYEEESSESGSVSGGNHQHILFTCVAVISFLPQHSLTCTTPCGVAGGLPELAENIGPMKQRLRKRARGVNYAIDGNSSNNESD
jgi:hypothetical protein